MLGYQSNDATFSSGADSVLIEARKGSAQGGEHYGRKKRPNKKTHTYTHKKKAEANRRLPGDDLVPFHARRRCIVEEVSAVVKRYRSNGDTIYERKVRHPYAFQILRLRQN